MTSNMWLKLVIISLLGLHIASSEESQLKLEHKNDSHVTLQHASSAEPLWPLLGNVRRRPSKIGSSKQNRLYSTANVNPKHIFTNLKPGESLGQFLSNSNRSEFERIFGTDVESLELFPFAKRKFSFFENLYRTKAPKNVEELSAKPALALPLTISSRIPSISSINAEPPDHLVFPLIDNTILDPTVLTRALEIENNFSSLMRDSVTRQNSHSSPMRDSVTPQNNHSESDNLPKLDNFMAHENFPNGLSSRVRTEFRISGLNKPLPAIYKTKFSLVSSTTEAPLNTLEHNNDISSVANETLQRIPETPLNSDTKKITKTELGSLDTLQKEVLIKLFDVFPPFSNAKYNSPSIPKHGSNKDVIFSSSYSSLKENSLDGNSVSVNSFTLPADMKAQVVDFIKPSTSESGDLIPLTTLQLPELNEENGFRQTLNFTGNLDPELFLADTNTPQRFMPPVGGTCITSFLRRGVCIPLLECPALASAATQRYQHMTQFLASNMCRFSEGRVYFCCPFYTLAAAVPGGSVPSSTPLRSPHSASFPPPDQCGEVKVAQGRIIGGTEVEAGSWPWLAALGTPRGASEFQVTCSGSLITKRHVLSAAHCFYDPEDKNPTHVRLAEYNVYTTEGPPVQDFVIVSRHDPSYYWTSKLNDIIVVTLDRDAVYSEFVQPVCLPFTMLEEPLPGRQLQGTGYGLQKEGGPHTPAVAHTVTLTARELSVCQHGYTGQRGTPIALIDHRSVCAGGDPGIGICNGDSGGPLHQADPSTGRYTVVGVMIASNGCGLRDFPSISTRVAPYLPWLMALLEE